MITNQPLYQLSYIGSLPDTYPAYFNISYLFQKVNDFSAQKLTDPPRLDIGGAFGIMNGETV